MYCPSCNQEIADGSLLCPNCGAQTADLEETSAADNLFTQPTYAPAPKKSNKGLIVGIVAALAVIAVVIILFVSGVFSSYNGKYVCSDFSAFGMNMELEVDGDDVTLTMSTGDVMGGSSESESQSGKIKFKGDEAIMTFDGEDIVAKYDKKEKAITISGEDMLGMELKFIKE